VAISLEGWWRIELGAHQPSFLADSLLGMKGYVTSLLASFFPFSVPRSAALICPSWVYTYRDPAGLCPEYTRSIFLEQEIRFTRYWLQITGDVSGSWSTLARLAICIAN
jgi:hypothetical protein